METVNVRTQREQHQGLEYNREKVDEIVLALLYLTTVEQKGLLGPVRSTWKSYDWDVMNRLHEKGYIASPINKNRSVGITDAGARLSEELFYKHFGPAK